MTLKEASEADYNAMFVRLTIEMKGLCRRYGLSELEDAIAESFFNAYGQHSLDENEIADFHILTEIFKVFLEGIVWALNRPLPTVNVPDRFSIKARLQEAFAIFQPA